MNFEDLFIYTPNNNGFRLNGASDITYRVIPLWEVHFNVKCGEWYCCFGKCYIYLFYNPRGE